MVDPAAKRPGHFCIRRVGGRDYEIVRTDAPEAGAEPLEAARAAQYEAEWPAWRVDQIDRRLAEIDGLRSRPGGAIALAMAAGNPPPAEDVARLAGLEAEADTLRIERAALLGAGP
ncbi:hypothetical protein [Roseospirillum parvum]|nr:hypothetical protein [Roseospirillum parvum]